MQDIDKKVKKNNTFFNKLMKSNEAIAINNSTVVEHITFSFKTKKKLTKNVKTFLINKNFVHLSTSLH